MSEMDIKAQVSLYTQGYESGLAKIRSENQSFTSSLSGIAPMIAGAFSAGAVISFANSLMQNAHNLEASSRNLGVNVESLQALRAAAKEAGVGEDSLDMALGRVMKMQQGALEGNLKMADAFAALNITTQDLRDLTPDELFARIGKALVDSNSGAKEVSASYEILGRSTSQFMGLLKDLGSDGLDPTVKKFKELGLVIDEAYIKKLADAEKAQGRLFATLKNWGSIALGASINFVEQAAAGLAGLIGGGNTEEGAESAPYRRRPKLTGVPQPRAGAAPLPPSPYQVEYEKKMLEQWEKAGPAAERVAYYANQIAQIEKNMGTGDEMYRNKLKILDLIEKQNAAQKQLNDEGKKDEEHMDKIAKLYDEQDKIVEDYKKGMAHLGDMKIAPLMTDSLAKMGGYVGGQVNPQMRVEEKHLRVAEESLRLFKDMNEKLKPLQKIQDELGA